MISLLLIEEDLSELLSLTVPIALEPHFRASCLFDDKLELTPALALKLWTKCGDIDPFLTVWRFVLWHLHDDLVWFAMFTDVCRFDSDSNDRVFDGLEVDQNPAAHL